MLTVFLLALVAILAPSAAHAEPITTAISAVLVFAGVPAASAAIAAPMILSLALSAASAGRSRPLRKP
jgi:hypothetical protein